MSERDKTLLTGIMVNAKVGVNPDPQQIPPNVFFGGAVGETALSASLLDFLAANGFPTKKLYQQGGDNCPFTVTFNREMKARDLVMPYQASVESIKYCNGGNDTYPPGYEIKLPPRGTGGVAAPYSKNGVLQTEGQPPITPISQGETQITAAIQPQKVVQASPAENYDFALPCIGGIGFSFLIFFAVKVLGGLKKELSKKK